MNNPKILKKLRDVSIPWFEQIEKTVLLPGCDKQQTYYTIKPPDYVTALARTVADKFIILKQFRPAIEEYTYELPSGHLEKGEAPAEAMLRELHEETGFVANSVTLMGKLIPDTGRLENRLWAFYIDKACTERLPEPEENEGIEVYLVSRDELLRMIYNGQLRHALDLSVIALAVFNKYLTL